MRRIKDKIDEIRGSLGQLMELVPSTLKEYKSDIRTKAACERFVEKTVEAMVDLAFIAIKHKNFEIPQDDIDAFSILMDNDVIDKDLAEKLKDAKGMRNILAHEYGKIDDEIVFNSIKEELPKDADDFLGAIDKSIK